MKIDPEFIAFLEIASKARQQGILKGLDDQTLKNLMYEIAEDPAIEKEVNKIL